MPPKRKYKKPKLSFWKNWGKVFFRFIIVFIIWSSIAVGLVILWFIQDLPNLNNLQTKVRNPSVTIQTQDGTTIGTFGDLFEDMVRIEELPPYVPQALMAVEDRRFHYHFGIDVIGLFRAAYENYRANRVVQGGSTLTQQLAKNFLISEGTFGVNDRSFKRKIQEVLLAIWLEWRFTKDQILTMYLNRVYFGAGTYGIDAAAQRYFHKSARSLTVFEAAVIAGLLKAPSRYSPASNPKKAATRAKLVLELMEGAGFIKNAKEYIKDNLTILEQSKEESGYKYFCDWVYETIPNFIGAFDRDLVVVVTLDPEMQRHAENVCAEHMEKMGKDLKVSEYSFLAITPNGGIKAMVGGQNYRKSQFNRVTQALRQPGSSFKMFIYLAAMESGLSPVDEINDTPVVIGNWHPSNYKWKSRGQITIREAFARSVNSVAVRLTQMLTPQKVIQAARKLGISSELQDNISIALGSLEVTLLDLTSAFATYANDGCAVWTYGILEIRDKEGHILYQRSEQNTPMIIKPDVLTKMRELMRAVITEGSGRAVNIGSTVHGKTGSNGDRDAWFIGYRSLAESENGYQNIVTGCWVGNDNNKPMAKHSTGSKMPTRVTAAFLLGPDAGKKVDIIKKPKVNEEPKQDLEKLLDKM